MNVDPSTFNDRERQIWFDGMRSGIESAAVLANLYNGQTDIKGRIGRAGNAQVDVLEQAVANMRKEDT